MIINCNLYVMLFEILPTEILTNILNHYLCFQIHSNDSDQPTVVKKNIFDQGIDVDNNNTDTNDRLHEENIPQLRAIVSWVKDNTTVGKSFIIRDWMRLYIKVNFYEQYKCVHNSLM